MSYLDYAGAAVANREQLQQAFETLLQCPGVNPHSAKDAGTFMEAARSRVLEFLGAPPCQYSCIFTSGTTAALQLLADAFPWTEHSQLLHTHANHTSVLAMRQRARSCGAAVQSVTVQPGDGHCALKRVHKHEVLHTQMQPMVGSADSTAAHQPEPAAFSTADNCDRVEHRSLLVLPGECNVTGLRPTIATLQALSAGNVHLAHSDHHHQAPQPGQLLVAVDASKLAQSAPLDLSVTPIHFLALSFYKVFGAPTGIGALVVRSDCLPLLMPPFLGGGTVQAVLPATWPSATAPRPGVAAFEPGTPNYQAIRQLGAGFDAWQRSRGDGTPLARCQALAAQLAQELAELRHASGQPAVCVYARHTSADRHGATPAPDTVIGIGESMADAASGNRGATVAFNCCSASGEPLSCHMVAEHLAHQGVTVRAGCCCNPGACAALLGFSDADLHAQHRSGRTCANDVGVLHGRHVGLVRASLGSGTNERDIAQLLSALRTLLARDRVGSVPGNVACAAGTRSGVQGAVALRTIAVYPVKSCAGTEVPAWPLTATGLLHDRAFLITDRSGRALKLAQHPQLLCITAAVDIAAGVLTLSHRRQEGEDKVQSSCAAQCAAQCSSIAVPLPAHMQRSTLKPAAIPAKQPCPGADHECESGGIKAQHDTISVLCNGRQQQAVLMPGHACGSSVHAWLSQVLQTPCHLVCVAPPGACSARDAASARTGPAALQWLHAGMRAVACGTASDAGTQTCTAAVRSTSECEAGTPAQSFVNAQALLIATTGSVQAFLAAHSATHAQSNADSPTQSKAAASQAGCTDVLDVAATVQRFRVNLLFDSETVPGGSAQRPHCEDDWVHVRLETAAQPAANVAEPCGRIVHLKASGPAQRCAVINAQERLHGRRGGVAALTALAQYRPASVGATWGLYMHPRLQEAVDACD